ncbi:zinc transporter ZIP1-like [Patiria miniata]|uniref:Uncharacterized protein n=1 Tax=Patiria miniata TaxID=46514 RepID=A0A914A133_PATMI|nr:zinc transporter ZIP1-like [Patiria miniata]
MLQATEIKVVAIFILLGAALLFGLAPVCLFSKSSMTDPKHRARLRRVVGWLNAFAGGVFMGIALIHLLPEARRLLIDAFKMQNMMYHFNWAELIAACGFFLIVFVEQIVYLCQERLGNNDEASEEVAFADKDRSPSDKTYTNETSPKSKSDVKSAAAEPDIDDAGDKTALTPASSTEDDPMNLPVRLTTLRAVILLISLSLHSIFEGLAIGLQLTRKDVIDIFIAIALHKGIEAFTISISFAQTYASHTAKTVYCVAFALMSPLGVAIGIPIAMSTRNQQKAVPGSSLMINAILQALATGTFMFVTFIEILPHELNSKKDGLLKFVSIVAGFAAISALNAIEHDM